MIKTTMILAVILLLLGATASGDSSCGSSSSFLATFVIHYPSSLLCSNCRLNFATDLDWATYTPESGYTTTFLASQAAKDTYIGYADFNASQVGTTHVATVYYNAWGSNTSDRTWLSAQCPNVLDNLSGASKGRPLTFTLSQASDTTFHLYPYFCRNTGVTNSISLFSAGLNLTKIIYYYRSPGLVENPLDYANTRNVDWEFSVDGFAISPSLSTAYDFLTSQGLIPDRIVYGLGQGIPTNPWLDGGAERSYETQPWECTNPYPAPTCAALGPKHGGGFIALNFVLGQAVPQIASSLGLSFPSRDYHAISGFSNGGLDACAYAYINSTVFSKAYCGSPSVWYNGQQFAAIVASQPPALPIKVFIDSGGHEKEPLGSSGLIAYQTLVNRTADFTLGINLMANFYPAATTPDSHQWNSWYNHLPLGLSFLYNPAVLIGYSPSGLAIYTYPIPHRPFAYGPTFVVPASGTVNKGAIPLF